METTEQQDSPALPPDWSKIPLHQKWWFQAVATLVIVPIGLALMYFYPSFTRRNGSIELVGRRPKAILAVLGALFMGLNVARCAADDGSNTFRVSLENGGFVTIQNIGSSPIEVREVAVNGRPECKAFVAWAHSDSEATQPQTLQVGDQKMWTSSCPIVRIRIVTEKGGYDFSFGK